MYNCQEITHVDLFTEQLVRKLILNRELETNYTREKKLLKHLRLVKELLWCSKDMTWN